MSEKRGETICISMDARESDGSNTWPVLISLKKAYDETCAWAAAKFPYDTPKSALLGALQSGRVRATKRTLERTTREGDNDSYILREFSGEYISPDEWAKCIAFNPLEDSMSTPSGPPLSNIRVHSADVCHWLSMHGDQPETHERVFDSTQHSLAEMAERRRFDEAYLLPNGRIKLKRRGAPTEYEWATAVAYVLLGDFHLREVDEMPPKRADWARKLQDALGTADGGPTASAANEYARLIMEQVDTWRSKRSLVEDH